MTGSVLISCTLFGTTYNDGVKSRPGWVGEFPDDDLAALVALQLMVFLLVFLAVAAARSGDVRAAL